MAVENMFECIHSSSWRKMFIAGSFTEAKECQGSLKS